MSPPLKLNERACRLNSYRAAISELFPYVAAIISS
jgi:hypothetical protein